MTYEENLAKLREAGVIDMTLSFGCKIQYIFENELLRIGTYLEPGLRNETRFYVWSGDSIEEMYLSECKILGNPLTIGRVLWRIEKTTWCIDNEELDVYARVENTGKIMDRRHNKDRPLDDQENREEIAEFLVSLIK